MCTKTEKRFISKSRVSNDIVLAGLKIQNNAQCTIAHQNQYLPRLKLLCFKYLFSDYTSLWAQLAWATSSRLDICCSVALLGHVTETTFQEKPKKFFKRILWTFKHLEKQPQNV